MQSLLIERFVKGEKKRMPEDSDRNKPLNSLGINYILNGWAQRLIKKRIEIC